MKSKNNSNKIGNKKTKNKKTILIIIFCIVVSLSFLSVMIFNNETTVNLPETTVNLPETTANMDTYIQSLPYSHIVHVKSNSHFHLYVTLSDLERLQNDIPIMEGIRVTLNESNSKEFFNDLKSDANAVVIFPVFTAAAYQIYGFYDYYRGFCDESCITDLSFETFDFDFGGSGPSSQLLYLAGYDFLTDIEVDKNPEILENYDTVILLHNEYVTKKEFDAISNHPNLIFLNPNALYAEIDVNYEDNTMTLIRGHGYPPEDPVDNAFDYEIEKKFHEYEYDTKCENWEFIEIENGFHLNCYPETIIFDNFEMLKKLKELIEN